MEDMYPEWKTIYYPHIQTVMRRHAKISKPNFSYEYEKTATRSKRKFTREENDELVRLVELIRCLLKK